MSEERVMQALKDSDKYHEIEIDKYREIISIMGARIKKLEDALRGIIALSHSWLIMESTARIEKPIHDQYRAKAKEALGE